jgi:integrase/recombinase XerD
MSTIKMTLKTDKPRADGTFPIYFRITKNRKSSYIASGWSIAEKYWDSKEKRVKATYPKSKWLNNFLSNKLTELENEFLRVETKANSFTPKALKEKIFGKEPTDFFPFADQVTETYKTAGSIGTYDKNKSIVSKLRDYNNSAKITFEEITPQFLVK